MSRHEKEWSREYCTDCHCTTTHRVSRDGGLIQFKCMVCGRVKDRRDFMRAIQL